MATNTVKMVLTLKDNASAALKKTGSQAKKTQTSISGLGKATGALALAAAAAAAAFIKMGKDVANIVNEVGDFAAGTGLAVETTQALQLMARSTGLELTDMRRAMFKFSTSVSEARDNVKSAQAEAFSKLGIDPASFRNTDEALLAVMDRLNQIEDSADRNKAAMDLFGGSGQKVLEAMQTDFRNARQVIQGMGDDVRGATDDAGDMQTAFALMQTTTDNLKVSAFAAFGGDKGFAGGMALVAGIMEGVIQLLKDIGGIVTNLFGAVGLLIASLMNAAVGNLDVAKSQINDARDYLRDFGKSAKDLVTLSAIEEGVVAYQDFEERMELLTKNADAAKGSLDGMMGGVTGDAREAARAVEDLNKAFADLDKRMKAAYTREGRSVGGLIVPSHLQFYGIQDDRSEMKKALVNMMVEDFEFAFDRAFDQLEVSAPDRGLRLLRSQIGDWRYADKIINGRLVEDYSRVQNELTKIERQLRKNATLMEGFEGYYLPELEAEYDVFGAQESLEALHEVSSIYHDIFPKINAINKEQEKAIVTEEDYRREIEKTREAANEHFLQLEGSGAALMELLALQKQYSEQSGKVAISDSAWMKMIEGVLGPETANQFGDDLDLALSAAVKDLKEDVEKAGREAEFDLLDLQMLERDLDALLASKVVGAAVEGVIIEDAKLKQLRVDQLIAAEGVITSISGAAATLAGGDVFGGVAAVGRATGTPQGMVVGAVFEGLSQFVALGELATDSSVKEVADEIVKSAELSVENFEKGIDVFMQVLPDMLVIIMTELPLAIIKALPALTLGIYEAFALALAEMFGWLKSAWESIKSFFTRGRDERASDRAEARQAIADWWEGAKQDVQGRFEEGYESYQKGTNYVSRTGLALLHRGESVVPVGGRAQQGARGSGGPVNININASMIDRDVIPRLVREIEKVTGKWGRMSASFA